MKTYKFVLSKSPILIFKNSLFFWIREFNTFKIKGIFLPKEMLRSESVKVENKGHLSFIINIKISFAFTFLWLILLINLQGRKQLVERWSIITKALQQDICSIDELFAAIVSYNDRYANKWKFDGLISLIEEVIFQFYFKIFI